jgi:zinc transport system substrate-binding protein
VHADGKEHTTPYDPHLWLGPPEAILMTKIIAEKLVEIDPAHRKGYEERAEKLVEEIKELQDHGKKAFAGKKHRHIITMHGSLGYFARAFDLTADPLQSHPGADPDSARMAALVKLCREKEVKVIAVEPQYSKSLAETLQTTLKGKGLDVQVIQVDPIETAPVPANSSNPAPDYYLKKMRENIDNLAKALQ